MVTQPGGTDKQVIYIWRGTARAFLAMLALDRPKLNQARHLAMLGRA